MKVLWITNIVFPEANELITGNKGFKSSGGWLIGMLEAIKQNFEVKFYTATASNIVSHITLVQGPMADHYIFPREKGAGYVKKYETYWRRIINEVHPDIVHIHGTELPHSLPCIKIFPNENYVVSIQGLISEIGKHYNDGLNLWDVLKNITLRDLYKKDLFRAQIEFKKRGNTEIEVLKSVRHVIGRTSWDYAITKSINPDLIYHVGNEALRAPFYTGEWTYKNCVPHTLFLSQVGFPYKGFHILIKSLPLVLRQYPDLQVRVTGPDVIRSNGGWKTKIRMNGYGRLLNNLIKETGLEKHISFLGFLDAEQMKNEYLKTNVFVSCSSIDNSPNSLGEAQMLGVPCVASFVGGVPDMIPNDNCGLLYRFEDYQKLAFNIIEIFSHSNTFDNSEMRKVAGERHDRVRNASGMIDIYKSIIK